jgi:hypothetical protein
MINRIFDFLKRSKCKSLYNHLVDPVFKQFVSDLTWAKYGRGKKDAFIRKFAGSTESVRMLPDVSNEKILSVPGLQTAFDGMVSEVQVVQLHTGGVALHYPHDKTWEGEAPGKAYSLQMTGKGRYDGSNGILKSDEGDLIECFVDAPAADAADSTAKKKKRKRKP